MNICALTPKQAEAMKPIVSDYIESALQHGVETLNDAWETVQDGSRVLFTLWDGGYCCGAMICELQADSVHIVVLGGDLPVGWKDELWPVLQDIARDQGKSAVELDGRAGWKRVLAPWGFKEVDKGQKTFMRAEL